MLWLVLSFGVLVVLLVLSFVQIKVIKPETKPYVIALLVILLLIICIIDELTIPETHNPISTTN